MGHLGAWIEGGVFALQSPLALAAVLATGLLVPQEQVRSAVAKALAFALVAAASGWLPILALAPSAVPAVLVVLGLGIACGLQAKRLLQAPVLVVGGLAAGVAGGMQTASWQEATGASAVLGGLLLLLWLIFAGLRSAPTAVVHVGRRAVGAWIGAAGLLLLALWWRSASGAG